MNKFSLNTVVVTAILGVTLFTGCGSSNNTPLDTTIQPSTVSGQGLAAYISGGNVFIDCDRTGTFTTGDINASDTNATGHFSVTAQMCADYDIVISGGTNSETNLAIAYPTIAPKGYLKISPLTTMIAKIPDQNRSAFITNLGLTEDDLKTDYNDVSTDELAAAKAKIKAAKTFVEAALIKATTAAQVEAYALAMNTAVIAQSSVVDFNNTVEITALQTSFVAAVSTYSEINSTVTDLNNSLTNQKTNIIALAEANTTAASQQASEVAEATNASTTAVSSDTITKLKIGSVNIGTLGIKLNDDGFTFDQNVTATTNIGSFYSVSVSELNATANFEKQTVDVSVVIKDENNNSITVTVEKIEVTGTNSGSVITSVIPAGTTITVKESGLSALKEAMGGASELSTTTGGAKTYNNSTTVDVNDFLNAIAANNTRMAVESALSEYLNQAGKYTVTMTVTGFDGKTIYVPKVTGTINVQASN